MGSNREKSGKFSIFLLKKVIPGVGSIKSSSWYKDFTESAKKEHDLLMYWEKKNLFSPVCCSKSLQFITSNWLELIELEF